jgi:hypothetical protein
MTIRHLNIGVEETVSKRRDYQIYYGPRVDNLLAMQAAFDFPLHKADSLCRIH